MFSEINFRILMAGKENVIRRTDDAHTTEAFFELFNGPETPLNEVAHSILIS